MLLHADCQKNNLEPALFKKKIHNTLLLHTEFEGLKDAVKERKWGGGQTADTGEDVGN